jgi:probable rRNA maturation factor
MPRAKEQAVTENHSIEDELNLLVVHGALHLLGYDHLTPGDRAEMWKHQAHVLSNLGISMSSFTNLES